MYADDLFWVAQFMLPLVICYTVYLFLKPRDKRLPPHAKEPFQKLVKNYLNGTIHRSFFDTVTEIGPVFQVHLPIQMARHFMICDASLARYCSSGAKSFVLF
jgi:hypothetical protein